MAVVLLKLLLGALDSLISLASLVFFWGSAILIVLVIRVLRVPGSVLDELKTLVEEDLMLAFKFVGDAFTSVASCSLDFLGATAWGIMPNRTPVTGEGIQHAVKIRFEGLPRILAEVFKAIQEIMIEKMLSSITSNFKDALKYIMDNV